MYQKNIVTLLFICIINSVFSQKTADDYLNSGIEKGEKNTYHAAISDFTKAHELDPTNPIYLINKSKAYNALQNYDSATIVLNQAAKLFPDNKDVKISKGWVFIYTNEFDLAINLVNELKKAGHTNSEVSILSGLAHQLKGDFNQAIVDFSVLLDENKNDESILMSRAESYMSLQQYSKALIPI